MDDLSVTMKTLQIRCLYVGININQLTIHTYNDLLLTIVEKAKAEWATYDIPLA